MGFNRGEIRVKATDISVVDRKGGESILGCQVMSGSITATVRANSHLHGRVTDVVPVVPHWARTKVKVTVRLKYIFFVTFYSTDSRISFNNVKVLCKERYFCP